MGTQPIPESKPKTSEIVDQPRIGPAMWLLLACFLIPPAVVTVIGNMVGTIPNQRLWVILLGVPIPLLLFSMPRRYTLGPEGLTITGLFYRFRVPRAQIKSVERVGMGRALVYPGSVFCSDPGRALLIERSGKLNLVISPRLAEPFLALDPSRAVSAGAEGEGDGGAGSEGEGDGGAGSEGEGDGGAGEGDGGAGEGDGGAGDGTEPPPEGV